MRLLADQLRGVSVSREAALASRSLLVLMIGLGCSTPTSHSVPTPSRLDGEEDGLLADERQRIEVFRRACPSVVHVEALEVRRDPARFNVLEIPVGLGSGFVWDDSAHIVTNLHVIRGSEEARVSLKDGRSWIARIMGSDPARDVAVLMIDAKGPVIPVTVAPSNVLRVGQTVLAIGNPFGLDHTLTVGVISALGRDLLTDSGSILHGVIQTDAAINPGSSGGPLLDSSGRLVGMNTAFTSPSGAFAGIGFAVPADAIRESVARILGDIAERRLGLGIRTAEDAWSRELGLSGVLVLEVFPGGPGERAGLRPTRTNEAGELELGDLIVSIDGEAVGSGGELARALEQTRPGDCVAVVVRRGKADLELMAVPELEAH